MAETNGVSTEKDFSDTGNGPFQTGSIHNANGGGTPLLGKEMESGAAMQQIQRSSSIAITPELFEKIYLTPQNNVKGDLRKTFGNPTPLYVP